MRRAAISALLISLALLAGCSDTAGDKESFENWRTEFLAAPEHSITAQVSAQGETDQSDYTLSYHQSETSESVEVLAPELIAKVHAELDEKGERLSFDGTILETGDGLGARLSPLMALPLFMDFVERGHLRQIWNEELDGKRCLAAELQLPDGMIMTLWLDYDTKTPVFAAIRRGETIEIKINFTID